MKLVLEVVEDRVNEAVTYAMTEIGARSLIMTRYSQNAQLTIDTRLRATDNFVQHFIIQGGIAPAERNTPIGFNIFEESIRFTYGNPGDNLFKLQFFDSPITPFGWCVARKGNPNINATTTSTELNNVNLGSFSMIEVFCSSSQAGIIHLSINHNGVSVTHTQNTQHPSSNVNEVASRPTP
ncbi:hypothetical protein LCGC14_2667470, partial [marine sediment metagenome]